MHPESEPQPHHVRLLRAIREKHRWTQAQLAFHLGVTERTIRNWERGHTEPHSRDLHLFRGLLQAESLSGSGHFEG